MFPLTAALAGSRAKLQIIESVRGGAKQGQNRTALVYSQKAAMVYNARAESTLTSTKPRTNMDPNPTIGMRRICPN